MTLVVHLEGMGLIGSLLAWQLEQHGVPFTWYDSYSRYTAWKACTGAIYPSGHAEDMYGWAVWKGWHAGPPWGVEGFTEEADYWFATKHPPHEGTYTLVEDLGYIRRGAIESLHLNAQRLVEHTRARFKFRVRDQAPPGAVRVVAHGFNERMDHVLWGWAAKAELRLPQALRARSRRACLYLRKGRFQLYYAYPVPGEPELWYVGSSLISQSTPHELAVEPKLRRWDYGVSELSGGAIAVQRHHGVLQGWRPAPANARAGEPLVCARPDGTLVTKPLWHCGVRHAPQLCAAVLESLGV